MSPIGLFERNNAMVYNFTRLCMWLKPELVLFEIGAIVSSVKKFCRYLNCNSFNKNVWIHLPTDINCWPFVSFTKKIICLWKGHIFWYQFGTTPTNLEKNHQKDPVFRFVIANNILLGQVYVSNWLLIMFFMIHDQYQSDCSRKIAGVCFQKL